MLDLGVIETQNQSLRRSGSNPNAEKNKTKKNALNEKEVRETVQKLLKEDLAKLAARLSAAKLPKKYDSLISKIFLQIFFKRAD